MEQKSENREKSEYQDNQSVMSRMLSSSKSANRPSSISNSNGKTYSYGENSNEQERPSFQNNGVRYSSPQQNKESSSYYSNNGGLDSMSQRYSSPSRLSYSPENNRERNEQMSQKSSYSREGDRNMSSNNNNYTQASYSRDPSQASNVNFTPNNQVYYSPNGQVPSQQMTNVPEKEKSVYDRYVSQRDKSERKLPSQGTMFRYTGDEYEQHEDNYGRLTQNTMTPVYNKTNDSKPLSAEDIKNMKSKESYHRLSAPSSQQPTERRSVSPTVFPRKTKSQNIPFPNLSEVEEKELENSRMELIKTMKNKSLVSPAVTEKVSKSLNQIMTLETQKEFLDKLGVSIIGIYPVHGKDSLFLECKTMVGYKFLIHLNVAISHNVPEKIISRLEEKNVTITTDSILLEKTKEISGPCSIARFDLDTLSILRKTLNEQTVKHFAIKSHDEMRLKYLPLVDYETLETNPSVLDNVNYTSNNLMYSELYRVENTVKKNIEEIQKLVQSYIKELTEQSNNLEKNVTFCANEYRRYKNMVELGDKSENAKKNLEELSEGMSANRTANDVLVSHILSLCAQKELVSEVIENITKSNK